MEVMDLRPHHGMCLGYYQGYGYSAPFNRRMQVVLEGLLENPSVRLTVGPDPICAECPNRRERRCESEERVRGYDRAVLAACDLQEGEVLPFLTFAELVQRHILDEDLRGEICGDCQWSPICRGRSRWEDR